MSIFLFDLNVEYEESLWRVKLQEAEIIPALLSVFIQVIFVCQKNDTTYTDSLTEDMALQNEAWALLYIFLFSNPLSKGIAHLTANIYFAPTMCYTSSSGYWWYVCLLSC